MRSSARKTKKIKSIYKLSLKEWLLYGSMGAGIAFAVVEIFYQNLWVALIVSITAGILFPLLKKNDLTQKRKFQIAKEFKDVLYSLSAALRAGRSLESAFEAVFQEMTIEYYPYIYEHWKRILARMRLQQRLEDVLYDFAVETEVDDIMSFAQIVAVSKKTEGDITKIIENTAKLLQEKMEMQQEIMVLLTRKKTEQKVLNCMPFLVIGMLMMMSPDYMAPLYTTMQGRIVMTVCIVLAVISIGIARKVSDISL